MIEKLVSWLRTQLDTHTGAQVKTPALRIRSSSRFVSARVGTEASARTDLLDAFLHASHGRLGNVAEVHREALERDALFYGRLSRWYAENGAVRDHNELFVAHLLTSPHPSHRVHARMLMQRLRVYQVSRVVKYVRETLHFNGRALKRAVEAYLRRREAHEAWFDECVIRDRHNLKGLYASLHIKPSARAAQMLFDETPPSDSRVAQARALARLAEDPAAQARLIVEHHIHYTTAIGAVKHYTPMILFALVKVMTPPQIITNLAMLAKRGAFEHRETKALLDQKIREAVRENRVSDFKTVQALRAVGHDARISGNLLDTLQQRLRNRGRIEVPTALFIDKSASMEEALEIGKQLAILCSAVADHDLHVFAFDATAFEINPRTRDLRGWEEAFSPICANNATSIGAPFTRLGDRRVEQIVVITDGEENTAPYFTPALREYEERVGVQCRIVVIRVGRSAAATPVETALKGREITVIPFRGDYYNLPNVVPLLCRTPETLLNEVLEQPLYTEEDELPKGYDEATHEIL
ncbi:MAG: hypothetical protein EB084_11090 [Proteobacteria bacterium]|nr:hypothetical protein [Pseudomonadota bacterium]